VVWGTGKPRREFLYSDDMADACIHLMELPEERLQMLFNDKAPPMVNIGYGKDLTIGELGQEIAKAVGFAGKLTFDTTKPDGTRQKLLDIERAQGLGWRPTTALADGIALAYADYLDKLRQSK
jgi:GDP-L-fucose synthase